MRYRATRLPSGRRVGLILPDGTQAHAELRDCSHTGAGLEVARPMRTGQALEIAAHGIRFPARVARVAERRVGVEFEPPLTPAQLSHLRGAGR